jgi:hypothetical protein
VLKQDHTLDGWTEARMEWEDVHLGQVADIVSVSMRLGSVWHEGEQGDEVMEWCEEGRRAFKATIRV